MVVASKDPPTADLAETDAWLRDLCRELGGDDRRHAWNVMAGFLHALRDRLASDDVVRLAAELPGPLSGAVYGGWWAGQRPEVYTDAEAFAARVAQYARLMGGDETRAAIDAAWAVLSRRVGRDELAAVLDALPDEVTTRVKLRTLRSR